MCKLKKINFGRVLEPAIAKLTPFVKFLPIDSINGVKYPFPTLSPIKRKQ